MDTFIEFRTASLRSLLLLWTEDRFGVVWTLTRLELPVSPSCFMYMEVLCSSLRSVKMLSAYGEVKALIAGSLGDRPPKVLPFAYWLAYSALVAKGDL